MKVAFLGNHTVGVKSLRAIQENAELVGIIAHPEDPEDGVRYESVFAEGRRQGISTVRMSPKSDGFEHTIQEWSADLLWIADFRYLLPSSVLRLPPLGVVNLHPSLLPKYRGRAPVNWAILRGETRLGLTAHFVDEGMDSGDIIAQEAFELGQNQDVGDALNLLYPIYHSITTRVLQDFSRNSVQRQVQDGAQATTFPRRTPADGRIDWRERASHVWNLVRAVAEPYPGAFSDWDSAVIRVWRAAGTSPFPLHKRPVPGEVMDISADRQTVTVACGDAGLVLIKTTVEGSDRPLAVGDRLANA